MQQCSIHKVWLTIPYYTSTKAINANLSSAQVCLTNGSGISPTFIYCSSLNKAGREMFQPHQYLRIWIFESPPESIDKSQGMIVFKWGPVEKNIGQRSSHMTIGSTLWSSRVALLHFPVLCRSFDLLSPLSRFFQTRYDLNFSIAACLISLKLLSGTDVLSSTIVSGVSETMAGSSDCCSVGFYKTMYLADTERV